MQLSRASIKPDNPTMTDITREEMTAHFDAADARRDALRAKDNAEWEIRQAKSDALRDSNMGRFEERIDQAIGEMRRDRVEIKAEIGGIRSDLKSFRFQIITSMLAIGVAVVLGIAAFNATVLSNMVASFESGKNTMQAIDATTKRLETLQDRIEAEAAQKRQAVASAPK